MISPEGMACLIRFSDQSELRNFLISEFYSQPFNLSPVVFEAVTEQNINQTIEIPSTLIEVSEHDMQNKDEIIKLTNHGDNNLNIHEESDNYQIHGHLHLVNINSLSGDYRKYEDYSIRLITFLSLLFKAFIC